jgi:signal transduction histidine kinase/ActR/RegA family two-component response regulator
LKNNSLAKKKSTNKEKQVENLLDDAYKIRVSDLSKSISLTHKALAISRKENLLALVGKSLSRLALYEMILDNHKESLRMSHEAINIFKEIDDEMGVAEVHYSIAGIYYKSNNFQLGMVYLLDCLMTFRKFKDYHNESRTQKSLGTIYEFLGDFKDAKFCYKSAINVAKKISDKNLESNAYNPLSGLLLKQNKSKKALDLSQKSISLKEETGDKRGIAFSYYGRGKVFLYLKRFREAENDFLEALKIHRNFGEKTGESMVQNKLAVLHVAMGNKAKAKIILKEVINFSDVHGTLFTKIKACHFLYTLCREDNEIENALCYLEEYTKLQESIADSQTLKVIENYETAAKIKFSEKEARLELEKAEITYEKEQVEKAIGMKQEFLSAMSHEIRTPLNAITSIIALLDDRSSEEDQKLLTSLQFSSKKLLRIIDDILDFSKLESNNMSLEKHPTLFSKLMNNITETYLGMAQEKGLVLNLVLDSKIAEAYLLDSTKLFQILGNLLSNAIKYTEQGSVVLIVEIIESENGGDFVRFSVKDTGIGISAKEKNKIFESFYIASSILTRDQGGTGLGLAIVKKMVALHQSSIFIDSELGQGSTFYFETKLEKSIAPISSKTDALKKLKGKKAMLVEDNEINAMVMTRLLKKYEIEVVRASDGSIAVELSKQEKVDFILMDIHMPVMDGFQATEHIRKNKNPNKETSIFALTADVTVVNHQKYQDHFDGFLSKPIQIERLFNVILGTKRSNIHGEASQFNIIV